MVWVVVWVCWRWQEDLLKRAAAGGISEKSPVRDVLRDLTSKASFLLFGPDHVAAILRMLSTAHTPLPKGASAEEVSWREALVPSAINLLLVCPWCPPPCVSLVPSSWCVPGVCVMVWPWRPPPGMPMVPSSFLAPCAIPQDVCMPLVLSPWYAPWCPPRPSLWWRRESPMPCSPLSTGSGSCGKYAAGPSRLPCSDGWHVPCPRCPAGVVGNGCCRKWRGTSRLCWSCTTTPCCCRS